MRRKLVIAAAVAILTTSGCGNAGLNSLPLPGTQGRADGFYSITVELASMSGMHPNSQVMVNHVNVGTVSDVAIRDWRAVATVRLNREVALPANASARIGQTSLLGAKHLELGPPLSGKPKGHLVEGANIPLSRTELYPETEDVLASASLLLNGGGLQKVKTITGELNRALGGRTERVRGSLTQLNAFAAGLDRQKGDIVAAMKGLRRLSGQAAAHNKLIGKTLRDIPPALDVLNNERKRLTKSLTSLGRFSDSATDVVTTSHDDIVGVLREAQPVLKALADSGDALVGSTGILATGPFPLKTYQNLFRGDYANLFVTVDLTNEAIQKYYLPLLRGAPGGELSPGAPELPSEDGKSPLVPPSVGGIQLPAPSGSATSGLLGLLGGGK